MKYFLDTEFIEKPNTIDLISIGIKCEDGRKLYLIHSGYNYNDASDWVKENVILPLYTEQVHGDTRNMIDVSGFQGYVGKTIEVIKQQIIDFVGDDTPEFWGYYADYDWVVFCWIFGSMIDLPINFPMYCRDLKQSLDESGKECIEQPENEHNAMCDAEWNEKLYEHIYSR